ncbi:MAG: hypothetical protein M3N47_13490 [Chloroflexota bacterium]|nr:hypothetical protein [Chloroflexota bacterium]
MQRVGVDRDVQSHLGAVHGAIDARRLSVVDELVELVRGDLVVVHG